MEWISAIAPISVAFICLYMPLLPLRRMTVAHFATRPARSPLVVQEGPVEVSAVQDAPSPEVEAALGGEMDFSEASSDLPPEA